MTITTTTTEKKQSGNNHMKMFICVSKCSTHINRKETRTTHINTTAHRQGINNNKKKKKEK
jgi:hypothetical protein